MHWDILGYLGAALVVLAYLLSATGVWPASGLRSALVNVFAGAMLIANGLYHGAMPSVALNAVWIGIGLLALLRTGTRRGASPSPVSTPAS